MVFFEKLKQGMSKTKTSFDEKISNVFKSFKKVDEDFLDELEEVLIMSDIGMDTSIKIMNNLRQRVKKEKIQDEEAIKQALREEIIQILSKVDNTIEKEVYIDKISQEYHISKEAIYGEVNKLTYSLSLIHI